MCTTFCIKYKHRINFKGLSIRKQKEHRKNKAYQKILAFYIGSYRKWKVLGLDRIKHIGDYFSLEVHEVKSKGKEVVQSIRTSIDLNAS